MATEPRHHREAEGRTWRGLGRTSLVVEVVESNDECIQLWIADPDDGPSVEISPAEAREVAADLIARADLIEGRHTR